MRWVILNWRLRKWTDVEVLEPKNEDEKTYDEEDVGA